MPVSSPESQQATSAIAPQESPAPEPMPTAAAEPARDPNVTWKDGLDAYQRKDYVVAAYSFEDVLKARPTDASVHRALATAYYQLGRHGEALREFEEALRLSPGDAALADFVAKLQAALGTK